MSYFKTEGIGFYLQDAYVQDWINNLMIFLEVEDVGRYWNELLALDLATKYENVKLTPIRKYDWGRECFMHDPSGILWHFGEFFRPKLCISLLPMAISQGTMIAAVRLTIRVRCSLPCRS